jgi:hypothetical protein
MRFSALKCALQTCEITLTDLLPHNAVDRQDEGAHENTGGG